MGMWPFGPPTALPGPALPPAPPRGAGRGRRLRRPRSAGIGCKHYVERIQEYTHTSTNMCKQIYVCICIYVYTCVYIYTYVWADDYVVTCMHIYVYVHMCVYVYIEEVRVTCYVLSTTYRALCIRICMFICLGMHICRSAAIVI